MMYLIRTHFDHVLNDTLIFCIELNQIISSNLRFWKLNRTGTTRAAIETSRLKHTPCCAVEAAFLTMIGHLF